MITENQIEKLGFKLWNRYPDKNEIDYLHPLREYKLILFQDEMTVQVVHSHHGPKEYLHTGPTFTTIEELANYHSKQPVFDKYN